jgi:bacterioferritin (cytochrome b1)
MAYDTRRLDPGEKVRGALLDQLLNHKVINLKGRKFTNVGIATSDNEYVTRAQLNAKIKDLEETISNLQSQILEITDVGV